MSFHFRAQVIRESNGSHSFQFILVANLVAHFLYVQVADEFSEMSYFSQFDAGFIADLLYKSE